MQKLEYKRKMLVEISARSTTINYSRCDSAASKSLAIRIPRRNKRGLMLDGDHGPSINILNQELNIFKMPQKLQEVTLVEIPKASMKQDIICTCWVAVHNNTRKGN